jgi:hypothetical protein
MGYCSAVTRNGWRWSVDTQKDDGRRYIVPYDNSSARLLELEKTLLCTQECNVSPLRKCTDDFGHRKNLWHPLAPRPCEANH